MVSGKIFATFLQWFDYLHYSKVVKVLFKHYEIEKKSLPLIIKRIEFNGSTLLLETCATCDLQTLPCVSTRYTYTQYQNNMNTILIKYDKTDFD